MKNSHYLICAGIFLISSTSYSLGQTPSALANYNPCEYSDPQKWAEVEYLFADQWSVHHRPGVATTPQGAMPFPEDPKTFVMDLAYDPRGLFSANDELPVSLEFSWTDEPDWTFNEVKDQSNKIVFSPEFTNSDLEVLTGCTINDMARIKAEADVTVEGNKMHFTYRLGIASADTMYGVMSVESVANGQPVTISRAVAFTRISN